MIEKPYLVHWSDDSDRNTETVATLDEAQTEIDRWLDLRRREADDGWALDMTGCIAVIVERVVEEESEASEGSSFDRRVDYHRERVPDPRDARIAFLEAENATLRAQLAAPLRLGRGPTVEEVAAHEPAGGCWLLRSDDSGRWDEWAVTASNFTHILFDGRAGLSAGDFNDAIPLNASRQPCRVGVKS